MLADHQIPRGRPSPSGDRPGAAVAPGKADRTCEALPGPLGFWYGRGQQERIGPEVALRVLARKARGRCPHSSDALSNVRAP
jgi:hypothetical protein